MPQAIKACNTYMYMQYPCTCRPICTWMLCHSMMQKQITTSYCNYYGFSYVCNKQSNGHKDKLKQTRTGHQKTFL